MTARLDGADSSGPEDFVARIRKMRESVEDLTWTGALFALPAFTEIHSQPQAHVDDALAALAGSGVSEDEKVIIALSMQKLPLVEFVRFSERVLECLEAGRLSDVAFESAVFPTYDWNAALAENFADADVQRLLDRVLASPAVSSVRKEIVRDVILTGDALKDVLELRGAGEIK